MKKIVSTLIGLTLCASAQAEFLTGNDLYNRLNDSVSYTQGTSMGYVMGVFDSHQRATHCAPNTVTAGQVRDMAKAYLEAVPHLRHYAADSLLRELFKTAWPCQNNNRNTL